MHLVLDLMLPPTCCAATVTGFGSCGGVPSVARIVLQDLEGYMRHDNSYSAGSEKWEGFICRRAPS